MSRLSASRAAAAAEGADALLQMTGYFDPGRPRPGLVRCSYHDGNLAGFLRRPDLKIAAGLALRPDRARLRAPPLRRDRPDLLHERAAPRVLPRRLRAGTREGRDRRRGRQRRARRPARPGLRAGALPVRGQAVGAQGRPDRAGGLRPASRRAPRRGARDRGAHRSVRERTRRRAAGPRLARGARRAGAHGGRVRRRDRVRHAVALRAARSGGDRGDGGRPPLRREHGRRAAGADRGGRDRLPGPAR